MIVFLKHRGSPCWTLFKDLFVHFALKPMLASFDCVRCLAFVSDAQIAARKAVLPVMSEGALPKVCCFCTYFVSSSGSRAVTINETVLFSTEGREKETSGLHEPRKGCEEMNSVQWTIWVSRRGKAQRAHGRAAAKQ